MNENNVLPNMPRLADANQLENNIITDPKLIPNGLNAPLPEPLPLKNIIKEAEVKTEAEVKEEEEAVLENQELVKPEEIAVHNEKQRIPESKTETTKMLDKIIRDVKNKNHGKNKKHPKCSNIGQEFMEVFPLSILLLLLIFVVLLLFVAGFTPK